ncbi:MAG: cytochrome c [Ignavibacteriaceae bacterium]|nr:cytochrome c [Ignavibacteriaceae bacterium]
MTKPQIWVAAFLAAFILLFILQKITKEEEAPRDFSSQMNNPMMEENTEELTAEQLINNFGCSNCHGSDLSGTTLAPALKNLSQYWGKDNLLSYLRNPNNYMNDERFKAYKEKYPTQIMPSYGNKNIKDLGKIVDYLLSQ